MNSLTWLTFLHILGAIIWVGGGLMLSIIGARVRKSDVPQSLRDFARILSFVGIRALMPAVLAVLIFGIWLVLANSAWSFTQLWIILALVGFAIAFVIGAIYLSRIAIGLDRLTAQADFSLQAARSLLNRWLVGYQVVLVVLLLVIWDMVFKPGV